MALKANNRIRTYEKTLVDFVAKDDGVFYVLSHDHNFIKMVRSLLNKELVIGTDRIVAHSEEAKLLSDLKTPMYKEKRGVLLIERMLHNRSTIGFIRNLKAMHENMHVIVLTAEVERQVLILLHEIGVSNFITKPVSMNTLIEKIAFTIRPQGKIGQYIDKAKEYFQKGMYDQSIELSNKILEIKPGSAAALMIKGDALKLLGQAEQAEAAYMEAHEGATLYLEPLKKLAELHREQGDLEKQLAFLKKLDKLSPLNVERKISMGTIHMEFGDSDKAEEMFDQAVVSAKKEAQLMMEEVKRSIAEKCIDKAPDVAERFFRSILESKGGALRKSDIETFNRLGIALRRQGRWEDAVTEYEQALKINPEDENLLFNMAVALAEGSKHAESVKELERVLAINPEFGNSSPVVSFNMGVMFSNARQPQKALRFLHRTLKLDPSHQGAKRMLSTQ